MNFSSKIPSSRDFAPSGDIKQSSQHLVKTGSLKQW